jgi:hypothetical protein
MKSGQYKWRGSPGKRECPNAPGLCIPPHSRPLQESLPGDILYPTSVCQARQPSVLFLLFRQLPLNIGQLTLKVPYFALKVSLFLYWTSCTRSMNLTFLHEPLKRHTIVCLHPGTLVGSFVVFCLSRFSVPVAGIPPLYPGNRPVAVEVVRPVVPQLSVVTCFAPLK